MTEGIYIATLIIYGLFLSFILLYSMTQLGLSVNYKKWKKNSFGTPEVRGRRWPTVTIQLPIFNEKYVVNRLIDHCIEMEYPKSLLEIQVLDDSTDETIDYSRKKIDYYQNLGYDIKLIRRQRRTGFKAGALALGTEKAKGEFIAIFDADFVPEKDFLLRTIPYFQHDNIGVVQSKWGHLNKNYSILTELQAFGLDAHFSVEQGGRNYGGHFINFNGTAGIWRKETIQDAGGWSADTLTEDLDLSYRAQLRGWKFVFLEQLESPAELPASMNALKAQQFRWTKGAAECARKNLGKVFRSELKLSTKIYALFHLMNSFLFVCIMGLALLSVPVLYIKAALPQYAYWYNSAAIFLASLAILIHFYWTSAKRHGLTILKFAGKFPLFLSMSMGLALHNAQAVIQGLLGKKTEFVRTPKFSLVRNTDKWNTKRYSKSKFRPILAFEILMCIYAAFGIYAGITLKDYALIPFHGLLTFGYGLVAYFSIRHNLILEHKTDKKQIKKSVLETVEV